MNRRHIPISIISFSVLFVVQYLLIYNTFELRNNQYQVIERKTLDSAYRHLLLNDKLFLGGQEIIDSLIKPQYPLFLAATEQNPETFQQITSKFCDTLVATLREKSNMDSIFHALVQQNELDSNLTYSLIITDFEITFDGRSYQRILSGKWALNRDNPYIVVDGDLTSVNKQNLITGLTVSSPQGNSYKIAFALHADDLNSRFYKILRQMAPTLALSFIAISMVIGIYYLTYRNWIRQKKMTEMTSDFLNSITHEFHTPITTIIVANRSLENLDKVLLQDKVHEFTAIIARQSSRLQKLIKQALNITELNQYSLEKENFPFQQLIAESVNDYRLSVDQNTEVELIDQLTASGLTINVNKFLFTTAIYNIFDNAIKYNQSIRKRITVKLLQAGDDVGLQISDNGIGLNEEQFQSIFQKFYRGQESGNKPGLGLGLFYVKKVAEAHGWRLDVTSDQERGTTFTIWLE